MLAKAVFRGDSGQGGIFLTEASVEKTLTGSILQFKQLLPKIIYVGHVNTQA